MKKVRHLRAWAFLTIDGKGPALAGEEGFLSRVSTPIVAFDIEAGTAITASGRPYILLGAENRPRGVAAFLSVYALEKEREWAVVAPEDVPGLIRTNGNSPFRHTAAEEASRRLAALDHVAGEIRRLSHLCESLHGLALSDIAEAAGMPFYELEALIAGSPTEDMTVEAAEAAMIVAGRLLSDPQSVRKVWRR